ncbi:WG repeat-containing protein [Dysgonomonas sp. 521]|uniref:WG repeat-containing protein n=1 Tax=Dysgonomonas sp. 521 TaxID=2302932 RepID=UPI0013D70C3F|nr:WG repeat-containing protein [Dysgonomonas sp. 521]
MQKTRTILFLLFISAGVSLLAQRIIPAQKNGKWGYIDFYGNTVIPFTYEDARLFDSSYADVRLNGKWGTIDKRGKTIVPCKYNNEPEWYNGMTATASDNKWGVIDSTGREIVPLQFDTIIHTWYRINNLFVGKKDDKYCAYYKDKILLPLEYENLTVDYNCHIIACKNGKYGLVDSLGTTLIPFIYNDIDKWTYKGIYYLKTEKNITEYYNINTGQKMNRNEYNELSSFGYGYKVRSYDDCDIYVNREGVNVFNKRFHTARSFFWDITMVTDFDLSRYCIDTLGNKLFDLPEGFYLCNYYNNRFAKLANKKESLYGIVNKEGEQILKNEFQKILGWDNNCFSVCKDSLWGIYDNKGKLISHLYSEIGGFGDGMHAVRKDNKWGYMDTAYNEVVRPAYDDYTPFSEGLASVCRNGKWGYINKKGKIVIPFIYNEAGEFVDGTATVNYKGKYGIIDRRNRYKVPFEYEQIRKEKGAKYDNLEDIDLVMEWDRLYFKEEKIWQD